MIKNKPLILAGLMFGAVGMFSAVSQVRVFAEDASSYPPIVQRLVERFNLDTSEVDKLMEEERAQMETRRQEMQAKRQTEIEDKLSQAVKDGKITEDQKGKILAKLNELRSNANGNRNRENMFELSAEERATKAEAVRAEAEQRKQEMAAWEEELGVKLKDIIGFDGFGFGGPGHMGKFPEDVSK